MELRANRCISNTMHKECIEVNYAKLSAIKVQYKSFMELYSQIQTFSG